MADNFAFAELILPLPLAGTFTYSIPENLSDLVRVGQRVIVQFGTKKFYTAIIKSLHNNAPLDFKTKEIVSILDEVPTILPIQFSFWDWISTYYLCSQGEVLKAALPSGLKLESETKLIHNELYDETISYSPDEITIIEILKSKESLTIKEVQSVLKKSNTVSLIKNLLEKKAIQIQEDIRDYYKPKIEQYVTLSGDFNEPTYINKLFDDLCNAKKQLEIVFKFIELAKKENNNTFSKKYVFDTINCQYATFNALVLKGVFVLSEKIVSRLGASESEIKAINPLNSFQIEAKNAIDTQFTSKDVVLLHGVTSSGKTEVYIHLIQDIISQGKQVLYLLPEIALTAQIINRLRSVFGDEVGIYHSKFSDAERVEIWENINKKKRQYKIILGVRSSVFLPFENLGLIIIDEEHENTYKQHDPAPRYHARDAAIVLAQMHGAKVLLGTATPAIETYHNALNNKFGLVNLVKRHKEISLPNIVIVDLKKARKQNQMHSLFSSVLLDKIGAALEKKEQIILFQNRRGYSPYLECKTCGHIPNCKFCEVSLTYHKHSNSLVCHYCGYTTINKGNCQVCSAYEIETKGFGTEKIEDELQVFFPQVRSKRMDLDSTRAKNAYSTIIQEFENHEIDVLIGTQMVTKGLDFENVSLVGILNAENMLSIPDFRAFERAFQLMTQVAGRAGRSKKQGEVIIQTGNPENNIIKDVINNDFIHMYETLVKEREQFHYPPYSRLIRISLKHPDKIILETASKLLGDWLRVTFGKRVLGPEFPPISRIQNLFIMNILLKVEKNKPFNLAKDILLENIHNIRIIPDYKSVLIQINVDPY